MYTAKKNSSARGTFGRILAYGGGGHDLGSFGEATSKMTGPINALSRRFDRLPFQVHPPESTFTCKFNRLAA